MTLVTKLQSMTLEQCPDTVEWCPHPNHHGILACGTYQLLEQESLSVPAHLMKRKGNLLLYILSDTKKELKPIFSVPTEAILDCKWHVDNDCSGKTVLGAADGKGNVTIYELTGDEDQRALKELTSLSITENGLALSLDWCSGIEGSSSKVCASDSNGYLALVDLHSGAAKIDSRWKCHDYEAWITAFNAWNKNIVYSGGDDCRFCGWDVRDTTRPTFISKVHDAGVCSIQCNKHSEYIMATGSYDEYIRLWDTRSVSKSLNKVFVGGGIWRLKWHHSHQNILLAACMYNGFKVIKFDCQNSVELSSFNSSDGSLAYGADWCRLRNCNEDTDIIGTSTFYDKSLTIWLSSLKKN